MSEADLGRLIVLTSRGDNDAFSKLYVKTGRGVYAFLYTYFHNREDTEDAMQTVYLKIKNGASSFNEGTNARAWILQIAKNHAINVINKKNREVVTDDIHAVDTKNNFGTVTDAMERCLTEEEQRIITLHVLWGYKHREIAQRLDCPTGTITSKYKRAVEKLRNALKEEK